MDSLAALPPDPADWEAHARTLEDGARWELGEAITREWIEGRLEPRLVESATGDALTAVRRHLCRALEACGVADELEIESRNVNPDESIARRWCWIEPWRLMSDDEDLLLMSDRLVEPLLDEAAAGCTKKSYALSIVAHHVRDQVHASLASGADAVRARIHELARFRPAAVRAGHTFLDAYLARLESYERPRRVTREEACARIADVWRCHAPPEVDLEPLANEQWRAQSKSYPGYEEWIVVDRKTGAMHLEGTKTRST